MSRVKTFCNAWKNTLKIKMVKWSAYMKNQVQMFAKNLIIFQNW